MCGSWASSAAAGAAPLAVLAHPSRHLGELSFAATADIPGRRCSTSGALLPRVKWFPRQTRAALPPCRQARQAPWALMRAGASLEAALTLALLLAGEWAGWLSSCWQLVGMMPVPWRPAVTTRWGRIIGAAFLAVPLYCAVWHGKWPHMQA